MSHRALNPEQFELIRANPPEDHYHYLLARGDKGVSVGHLSWHHATGHIQDITVSQKHRRQGIATALWHEAHRIAETGEVKPPKHSVRRTGAGDAWARSVGGDLP